MLSLNPDVLLLDEPTSGLDPRTQRKLIRMIQQLNEAGKTIITATHNLDIVEEIADRALVFSEDHHLVAMGPCEEILCNIDSWRRSTWLMKSSICIRTGSQTLIHAHDGEKKPFLSLKEA